MTAFDVAAYVIAKRGVMSLRRLQALVYFAQAWALAWTGGPLFDNVIQARREGPTIVDLDRSNRGEFEVRQVLNGDAALVTPEAAAIIDAILDCYGDLSAQVLCDLTQGDDPWLRARPPAPSLSAGAVITQRSMRAYYSWLSQARVPGAP